MAHTILLSGRIDTASAPLVDQQIAAQLSGVAATEQLVLDFADVGYISSTGLRVILKYKKLYPLLEVINASLDVYNVFEITGFSRIITIKKALRRICIADCKLLARGGNGEVWRVSDEEIMKLALRADGEDELVEEMNRAREAFLLGVPTVISFDEVMTDDGRRGIIMEAVNSDTLSAWFAAHPTEIGRYIPQYADIFRSLAEIEPAPGQFRTLHSVYEDSIRMMKQKGVEQDILDGLTEIMNAVPKGNRLVHYDGHPRNILMVGEGDNRQLMLIDMGDLCVAHPMCEIIGWSFMMIAPEYSIARYFADHATALKREVRVPVMRQFLSEFFHVTDGAMLDRIMDAAAEFGQIKLAFIALLHDGDHVPYEDSLAFTRECVARRKKIIEDIQFLMTLYK